MGSSAEGDSKKLGIILDTNVLMLPLKININLIHEMERVVERSFEAIVLDCIIEELKKLLQKGSPKTRREAAFALKFAERFKFVKVPDDCRGSTVDETIMNVAKKYGWYVATCDNELRRKLRKMGIPVIFLRQASHFELEGGLV